MTTRTLYICNAFSLSMLDRGGPMRTLRPVALTTERARDTLTLWHDFGHPIVSAVGHADTARIFARILNVPVPANRTSIKLGATDHVLVGQYSGPRLPEGATALPLGATIEWWIV